ncbi:MAG: hypothetical protein IPO91_25315 [Chloroflexi bacterium]|nr:hypothetical protein [Chloroflexota bacterium]
MVTQVSKLRIAQQALEIMKISSGAEDNLDTLVHRLRTVIPLAASSTELEIRRLSNLIADTVENSELEETQVKELLEKLEFEVTFLPFD